MTLDPLPIDPLLPEICQALRTHGSLVLCSPPGSGKTTRVPPALLAAGLAGERQIFILEPRRLAARLAARRVAQELGEQPGARVGWQVRFETVGGTATRIWFLTEGLLLRKLAGAPELPEAGVVILDEFHERHLHADGALAALLHLQRTRRPDLKLVVMSATLDAGPLAKFLGAPVIEGGGRLHPVELEHLRAPDARPLAQQVAGAVKRAAAAEPDGDLLVFLPGAGEIRRALESCREFADHAGFDLVPLHGELPAAEQDRAVTPGARRKIILSTNVAESSVTLPAVTAVIDSGLHQRASFDPLSGMPALETAPISRASAIQRAGRAGRVRPGRCLRLYSEADLLARPAQETPEIRRADLAEWWLTMLAAGIDAPGALPFFDPPPAAALAAAQNLLARLGAIDAAGRLTDDGRQFARLPLHPRLARLLFDCARAGCAPEGAVLAALLGERDPRREARAAFGAARGRAASHAGSADPLEILERVERAGRRGASAEGLDPGAVENATRAAARLLPLAPAGAARCPAPAREEQLLRALLAAWPDRLARRRAPGAPQLVLPGLANVRLDETSVVRDAPLLVALAAQARGSEVVVTQAARVEPEWLLELDPDGLEETRALELNEATGRVEQISRARFRGLVIEESRRDAPPSPECAALLAQTLLARGPGKWPGGEAIAARLVRLRWAAEKFPDAGLPTPDDAWLRAWLTTACADKTSLRQLGVDELASAFDGALGSAARALAQCAPATVPLSGGRHLTVNYEPDRAPWIQSRMQDFFGMAQGPSAGAGRIPLVLHLNAPNGRAVQVTGDLAGFWKNHYPALRQSLMRQYPKHHWPENPVRPGATPPRQPRSE